MDRILSVTIGIATVCLTLPARSVFLETLRPQAVSGRLQNRGAREKHFVTGTYRGI